MSKKKKKASKRPAKSKKKPSRPRRVRRTKAPGKKRKPRVVPVSETQIQKFREVLSQKRDDLLATVHRKKEEEIEESEIGDEADIATKSIEKEMLFELTDSEKQTVDMIEMALRKIERGIFGTCERCSNPIPRLRLGVMPWVRYCFDCQASQESPAAR